MIVNLYKIFEMAIDQGVARGVRRFYKHREDSPPDGIEDAIADEVMTALSEYITFDEQSS